MHLKPGPVPRQFCTKSTHEEEARELKLVQDSCGPAQTAGLWALLLWKAAVAAVAQPTSRASDICDVSGCPEGSSVQRSSQNYTQIPALRGPYQVPKAPPDPLTAGRKTRSSLFLTEGVRVS